MNVCGVIVFEWGQHHFDLIYIHDDDAERKNASHKLSRFIQTVIRGIR